MREGSTIRYQPTEASPMIVATDGQAQSDGAIRAGAVLGGNSNAWWVATVASPFPIVAPELDLQLAAEAVAVHRENQVRSVHEQMRRILGASNVRVEVLDGNPAGVIAGAATQAQASLIVAGLGRHNIVDRVLGDETVLRLVRSTSTPVLAVGPEFAIPETIVVGIDFSENSLHAAQLALRFVDHDSTIHLIHVVPDGLLGMVAGGPAEYHERAMAAMSRLVTQIIRRSPVAVLTLPE